jgi:hypothetical protein
MIVKLTHVYDNSQFHFLIDQLCEIVSTTKMEDGKTLFRAKLLNRTTKKQVLLAWGNYYSPNHMFIDENGNEYDFTIQENQFVYELKEKLDKILEE